MIGLDRSDAAMPRYAAPPMERRRGADRRRTPGLPPAGMAERRRNDRRDARPADPAPDHPPALNSTRARRYAAARVLSQVSGRDSLEWEDLAQWPDWAALPARELTTLAWAVGAWSHVHELRRCVEGRVLKLLDNRLGDAGLRALLDAPDAPAGLRTALPSLRAMVDGSTLFDPVSWESRLLAAGRECLLASVGSPSLRQCLRERLWRKAADPGWELSQADAAVVVRAALSRPRTDRRPA